MELEFKKEDLLIAVFSTAAAALSLGLINLFMPGEVDTFLALAFWIAFTVTVLFGRRYVN